MASRDALLIQGNVLQSALVTFIAGGALVAFKPNVETITRFMRAIFVGCGKRIVNTAAIYGFCSGIDFIRRSGFNFWFLNNKIGADNANSEYFMSSSFRFVTFAASSGASCMTNYITKMIGLYGPRKVNDADGEDATHEIETTTVKPKGVVGHLSRIVQFYDTEGTLRSYTNLARLLVQGGIYGISTVLAGSGLLPVTFGPIDNETHVRVLSKCGPSEFAYWSVLTALSTLSAETAWNIMFWIATYGAEIPSHDAEGEPVSGLGFTVFATVVIGIAAAAINGSTVYVVGNRSVAILGEDGEKQDAGTINTVCKVIHDNVFCRIFDRNKGVAYIWTRCIGHLSSTVTK